MQDEIAVLVIEDELILAKSMVMDLEQFGFKVAACVNCVEDALPVINNNEFDIALVDIHLERRNSGYELGRMISQNCRKPFIFVTAYADASYAEEAIDAGPVAYLSKPVSSASLFVTIQSALQYYKGGAPQDKRYESAPADSSFFFVKQGNMFKKINWSDVVCLRSDKNYTHVITNDRNVYLIRSSLNRTMKYIIPDQYRPNFVQINRAELLQLKYINELMNDQIKTSDQMFYVTEGYFKNLKQKLHIVL